MARLSAADIRRARQADLASYLRVKGYELRREGKQLRVPNHGGLVIDGFKWYCFSTGQGGNAVDLLVTVLGLPFAQAVEQLLAVGPVTNPFCTPDLRPPGNAEPGAGSAARPAHFTLPPPAASNTRVLRYLTQHRLLPVELVEKLIALELVYQDTKHNAAFVCRDSSGRPRAAVLRGTDRDQRFVGMAPGSDSAYGWHLPPLRSPVDHVVAVTESPIDSLSLLVLRPALECFHHLSVNGVRRQTTPTFLDDHPDVRTVVLGLDADKTGLQATAELSADLRSRRYTVAVLQPPDGVKDWNDALAASQPKKEVRPVG